MLKPTISPACHVGLSQSRGGRGGGGQKTKLGMEVGVEAMGETTSTMGISYFGIKLRRKTHKHIISCVFKLN